MLYYFNKMIDSEDEILSDLATRLLNRKLFGYVEITSEKQEKAIREKTKSQGYDPKYYIFKDTLGKTPYSPYESESSSLIYILTNQNKVVELSKVSEIVAAISAGKEKSESKLFFPKEVKINNK